MEELKSGIYKITCLQNGRVYVGQAINIKDRWTSHMQCLNRNKHHNIHLQRAWNKYGEECFKFDATQKGIFDVFLRVESNMKNHFQMQEAARNKYLTKFTNQNYFDTILKNLS